MTNRTLLALIVLFVIAPAISACAVEAEPADEPTAHRSDAWDSEGGNPTHATHTYLTEAAIDAVSPGHSELETFHAEILAGANTEIHDISFDDPDLEALRQYLGGTNAGCAHPDLVWKVADSWHRAGDLQSAYWFVGLLLHYVEDMGVPAHALGVYHQATIGDLDDFELLALQWWQPSFAAGGTNPWLSSPSDYVDWSAEQTSLDFSSSFPGETYTTKLFPPLWGLANKNQRRFVEERQGSTALAATWTLERIVLAWSLSAD